MNNHELLLLSHFSRVRLCATHQTPPLLSRFRLLATLWTAAYQAPPSTGFSRQENWSGVSLPSPIHEL